MPVDFDEFVEQQERDISPVSTREEKLAAWKNELAKLYASMKEWLKPYIDSGKVRIEPHTVELVEEYLGRYEAPALSIFIGNNEVIAEPVGSILIGAKGRVDLSGPRRTSRFVLLEEGGPSQTTTTSGANGLEEKFTCSPLRSAIHQRGWYKVTSPPDATATLLDADSFKSAIMDVASAYGI